MKTPIQSALELLRTKVKNCHNSTTIFDGNDYVQLDDIINVLGIAEDEEKQCIIDAHESGFFRDGDEPQLKSINELKEEAKQYYKETFNQ